MPTLFMILLVLAVILVAAAQLAPPASKPLSWIAIGLALIALLLPILGAR